MVNDHRQKKRENGNSKEKPKAIPAEKWERLK